MIASEPKRKGRPPKKIQHQVFQILSGYTLDEYWSQLLLACSIGKFPRFVNYKDDILTYRRGRASSVLGLNATQNTTVDFKRVLDFFRALGLSSHQDDQTVRQVVENKQKTQQSQVYQHWSEIKRPQNKDLLLSDFVQSLSEQLNLTTKEHEYLQAQIAIARLFKIINAHTVVMSDGKITELVGLQVEGSERGKRRFVFPRKATNITSSMPDNSPLIREDGDTSDQSKDLSGVWSKYCDELRKYTAFCSSCPVV